MTADSASVRTARVGTVAALNPKAKLINFPKRRGQHPAKGKKYPPDPLLADDIALLLKHCVPSGPQHVHKLTAARLRGFIAVGYRTGLRCSELLDLVPSDLLRSDDAILVRHGKGDKRRTVVMDPWGWKELDRWLALRNPLPSGYVFCTVRDNPGGRLDSSSIRRELRRLQARSGITKRVAAHQLRHGHAVELWRENLDLYTIQTQLGHARLDMTARYLKGVDPINVLKPIKARQPPRTEIS